VDLLLTDMNLPYLKGDELITQLRPRRRTLNVLVFSGYPLNAPDGVPFLLKPFARDELLAELRDALGRKADRISLVDDLVLRAGKRVTANRDELRQGHGCVSLPDKTSRRD
jgi:DNA-binding response OmpR family regulator